MLCQGEAQAVEVGRCGGVHSSGASVARVRISA